MQMTASTRVNKSQLRPYMPLLIERDPSWLVLQQVICCCVISFMFANSAASDEPPRGQRSIAHRLPSEDHGASDETSKLSLDELQLLCDKLKRNGEVEDAELLKRFIQEYQRLAKAKPKLVIKFNVIEVNLESLPHDSILRDTKLRGYSKEVSATLERLVKENKAGREVDDFEQTTTADELSARLSAGKFALPVKTADGKLAAKYQDCAAMAHFEPTITSTGQIHLKLTYEVSDVPVDRNVFLAFDDESKKKGFLKLETEFVVTLGDVAVHQMPSRMTGRRLFILTTVNPKF